MTKFFFPDLGDTMFDGPTTLEPILAEHPFLKGMEKEHLALITGCASNVKWDAGTYLFKEGQDADQFYIIRQGTIAIEAFSPAHGPLVLQTRRGGRHHGLVVARSRPTAGTSTGTRPISSAPSRSTASACGRSARRTTSSATSS